MKKKVVSAMLIVAMSASLVGCGKGSADANTSSNAQTEEGTESAGASDANYDATSSEIYDAQLGDFYEAYQKVDDASSVSEKYALEAVAEAKLLESGVMLPTRTRGGMYAISRVAPRTVDYTLWGNDYERFHQALVATDYIKAADRAEMKAKWAELKGTGTYEDWAKSYLQEKGYTLKDTYNYVYPSDPVTWDVLATSLSADSEAIINTYDGLMEYDCEGTLQPALAESYEVSDDGLTYTFKLREGVKWVDSQGREVADVTADDFVAGMQHMMDAQGGLEYLVEGIIKNASEYIDGSVTDFSQVGVKAVDDYTVEYDLEAPCTYFTTMLGYGVFAPMSRTYYESQGGKFGQEYDSSASDYTYGKDPNSIAYCGPYLVTNATAKNTIVFQANDSYWNKDNINIKTLTWVYNDGTDVTKTYTDLKSGVLDGANLNTSTIETAKTDGLFDDYAYVTDTEATSYMAFYNLNRAAFANTNDDTTVVSSETDEQKAQTNAALQNVHFRRAISFGVDRASYNAQVTGEDLKYNSLRNGYTPGTFVSLDEDVTIDINGEETTFPAGTYYGEIEQAQIDADGVKIKVWDSTADEGNGSSDGFDGWYSPENAMEELNTAIDELKADGVTIDADNPVVLDLPYASNDERYTNMANAYKQSLEASLEGLVKVNLVAANSNDEWYYAGYYTSYGYEANYDIYDLSGWGPDYGDPKTYLDTFLPDYAGYMVRTLGIF
ncbi:peptide ABC transporter substrate-binding protein [Roseburia sp. 831b]|uniref:peptide ABC transporter substrate-binding protein n=1 Tax=Roseburia sp. 831b TaxID=1261635 RepID=UPI00095226C2|nr:peptide ABC transporter substrate-binding protein [Roseburia sp. 831b]WVK72957.1 peptide ABC transporter substrate-binding protein [Roseburia sp. 831b]